MGVKVNFMGEVVETDVEWSGSVWRRSDTGSQSGSREELLTAWLQEYVLYGGDSPHEYRAEIAKAVALPKAAVHD